jgi:hypothetical protein
VIAAVDFWIVLVLVGLAAVLGAGLLVVLIGWMLGWRALHEAIDEIRTRSRGKDER